MRIKFFIAAVLTALTASSCVKDPDMFYYISEIERIVDINDAAIKALQEDCYNLTDRFVKYSGFLASYEEEEDPSYNELRYNLSIANGHLFELEAIISGELSGNNQIKSKLSALGLAEGISVHLDYWSDINQLMDDANYYRLVLDNGYRKRRDDLFTETDDISISIASLVDSYCINAGSFVDRSCADIATLPGQAYLINEIRQKDPATDGECSELEKDIPLVVTMSDMINSNFRSVFNQYQIIRTRLSEIIGTTKSTTKSPMGASIQPDVRSELYSLIIDEISIYAKIVSLKREMEAQIDKLNNIRNKVAELMSRVSL